MLCKQGLNTSLGALVLPSFHIDLSIFYRYFHGHCSQEIRNIIPDPVRHVRTTRSSTHSHPFKLHYLIHELWLTNHLSFQELLTCGTHCHPLLSLNPTICHLSNITSTNLILSPFLLNLFPFSQSFLCRGFLIGPTAFPRH